MFFRGKRDSMQFPLTGYAPCDIPSWLKVFKKAKRYGINLYSFVACCPPEAAFYAADSVGIYLMPEIPYAGTIETESSEVISYILREGERILRAYGSHPSFALFSMGAYLRGDKERINNIIRHFRTIRSDILYTQGSNCFGDNPCILEGDDFYPGESLGKRRAIRGSYAVSDPATGFIQSLRPTASYNYNAAFDAVFDTVDTDSDSSHGNSDTDSWRCVPVISHEIGQYAIYPDYRDIEKFTGVLKPYNLMIFRQRLTDAGMGELAERFFKASGQFAALLYKIEIETALRTEKLAGFCLRNIQDLLGLGAGTVGILNAFMENKGLISREEWNRFCSPLTIIGSFDKFTYLSEEHLLLTVTAVNYSGKAVVCDDTVLRLFDGDNEILSVNVPRRESVPAGRTKIAEFDIKLPYIPKAKSLDIEISACDVKNNYTIWCYPERNDNHRDNSRSNSGSVFITSDVTNALTELEHGGKVLFFPTHTQREFMLAASYCTDFWSYSYHEQISQQLGKPAPIGTLGLLIDKNHPALAGFPCESYSTPQWYDIVTASSSLIMDGLGINPIVYTIDNVKRNHKLGLIFEAAAENGKLLVCMSNFDHLKNSIPANELLGSLISYMETDAFAPTATLSRAKFRMFFTN
jgi:hypothetical protein